MKTQQKKFCVLKTHHNEKTIKKWSKDLNGEFSKENIQMANKHVKMCPTSLAIRERPMKTTVRYHFTSTRMSMRQKTDNDKC